MRHTSRSIFLGHFMHAVRIVFDISHSKHARDNRRAVFPPFTKPLERCDGRPRRDTAGAACINSPIRHRVSSIYIEYSISWAFFLTKLPHETPSNYFHCNNTRYNLYIIDPFVGWEGPWLGAAQSCHTNELRVFWARCVTQTQSFQ